MIPSVRHLKPTRDEMVDGAFAFALVALALWAFESAFGGTEFLVVGLIGAAVSIAVTHLCVRRELPVLVMACVWSAVFVVVGGALAARSQALFGVLPSPNTAIAAIRTSVQGWKQLLTTVPPVGRTGDLLVLPVFCGMLGAGAGYALSRRASWTILAAAPAIAVMALGILCGTQSPVSVLLHGGVMALGIISWGAVREHRERAGISSAAARARRLSGAGVLLGVSVVLGLAAGDSLPFSQARDRVVWRDAFEPPFDPSVYPSPLGYYRHYVKTLEEAPLFTVAGLPDGAPIRMATLDSYDGIVWKVTGGTHALRGSAGYFERVGTDVTPDYGEATARVRFEFPDDSSYDEVWLPTVGESRSINFESSGDRSRALADGFRYNRTTDAAAALGQVQPGDAYEIYATVPVGFHDLASDAVFAETTFQPIDGIPGPVAGLGSGLLDDVDGVERVQILVDFLSESGYYSDSGEDQSPVPAGHGAGRLLRFTDASELVGNAEQYAATLGLILRNSGIPARVAMGFVPKEYDPDGMVTIVGGDAEAWVEVLIDDVGWVPVFPTPDRSRTTVVKDESPKPVPDRETQVPPPPPVVEPDAETDPASESTQAEREPEEKEDEDDEEEASDGGPAWLLLIGAGIVLFPALGIGLLIGSILFLKQRRRRRRRSGRGDQQIAGGWRELVDYAVDAGRDVPLATTRSEAAISVGSESGVALASRADAAVFGPVDVLNEQIVAYWSDVDEARRSLRGGLGPIGRVKAHASLESFRRAKSERRADERQQRRMARRERHASSIGGGGE